MIYALELAIVTFVSLTACYSVYCVGVSLKLLFTSFSTTDSVLFDKDNVKYTDGDNT